MTPRPRKPTGAAAARPLPGHDDGVHLGAVLEAVSDGITVQNARGDFVYANAAAARLLGFDSPGAILHARVADVLANFELHDEAGAQLPPERLPGARALAGEPAPEELVGYRNRRTGEGGWLVVRARALRSSAGAPRFVVNAFHTVTDQIRQQRTLEETAAQLEELATEQEQTLEELRVRSEEADAAREAAEWAEQRASFLAEAGTVLASSLDFQTTLRSVARLAVSGIADWCTVHLLDGDGDVRRLEIAHADPARLGAAREIERRYPPRPETSVVHRVVRTGTPELYPEVTPELLESVAEDDEHLRLLRELGLRSGMIVPLIAHDRTLGALSLLISDSGRRYDENDLTFGRSLAARAALAIHTSELYDAAQEANRAKAEFLAVISHELRTPLNAIMGYTDLLAAGIGGTLSDVQERQLGRIGRSAQHLAELIETVLTFARIEAGREEVELADTDIADVASEAVDLMSHAAAQKGLTLTCDADPDTRIPTDAARVRQVVLNLLSNAVKFTEEGTVRTTVRRDGGDIAISVADTGIGIADSDLPRIWEPFVQVDAALTRGSGGTGLGLPVSASLADLLGGRIDVDTEPGRGSTFTLRLPADPD